MAEIICVTSFYLLFSQALAASISVNHLNDSPLGKRLYTLKEAAEYLGRSVWGVRELIWSQVIPVVKQIGCRKIYLDIKDLDAFIENNKAIYN